MMCVHTPIQRAVSGANMFGRNTAKAIFILLPDHQPDAVSLASSRDEETIRTYNDLEIISIDKALCEQKVTVGHVLMYR